MELSYVEQRNGDYWIRDTRVSLDSIVYRFLEGLSPETIADCFPTLTLEQVYGAITYYLAHRAEINAYLKAADKGYEAFRQRIRDAYPDLSRRLDELLNSATSTFRDENIVIQVSEGLRDMMTGERRKQSSRVDDIAQYKKNHPQPIKPQIPGISSSSGSVRNALSKKRA